MSLGIRDVVLPGEMKELMNKVIEALEEVAEKGRLSVVVGEGGLAGRVAKIV